MLGLLLIAALALAYANGANDNLKATATAYGAGWLGYGGALRLATAAQLTGSLASVALAGSLVSTFGGNGLVPEDVVGNPTFLVSVAGGAGATVLLATRVGLPISTTHALVGALVGSGLAHAPEQVAWSALGGRFFLPLAMSPLLALVLAAVLHPLATRGRRALGIGRDTCLCIDGAYEPILVGRDGSVALRRTGLRLHADELARCRTVYPGRLAGVSTQSLVDGLHGASAFALGFARALNDTPKVLALLIAAGWTGLEPRRSLVLIAAAMALGGLLRARRVAETLAHRITPLSHGQGLLSNAIASGLVIGASLIGSPVSTTHVSTGSLFGIGLQSPATDWSVVNGIVAAWLGTLPVALVLAVGLGWLLA